MADAILSHGAGLGQTGRTEFHLRLDPPELGPVHVHLSANGDTVSGRLVVHDEAARQALVGQMHTLRTRLQDAGVSLGRLDVSREGNGSPGRGQQRQPEPAAAPAVPRPRGLVAGPVRATVARAAPGGLDVVA